MSIFNRDPSVEPRTNAEEDALDATFRRSLLESARGDHVSDDATRAAWTRLAGAMGTTSALTVGGAALQGGAKTTIAGKGAAALGALKWILVGAIGGSALTAALIRSPAGAPRMMVVPTALTHVEDPPVPTFLASATPAPSPVPISPQPRELATTSQRPRRPNSSALPRETPDLVIAPAVATTEQVTTRTSTLAAEVSVLDAARLASASGAFDDALRLVDRYHREFPAGALAADADVIGIDALQGKHDQAGVAAQSAKFLSRYPNDPHAAHVRRVAGER